MRLQVDSIVAKRSALNETHGPEWPYRCCFPFVWVHAAAQNLRSGRTSPLGLPGCLQPCPGFPIMSSSHTRCSCAILRSHMNKEQSSSAELSTCRQGEPAQGCRRRRRGGWRQISSHGQARAQTRTALSDSSKAIYTGPSDERKPFILSYLPTRVSGWTLSRRYPP